VQQRAKLAEAEAARGRLSHDDLLHVQQEIDIEDVRLAGLARTRALEAHALATAAGGGAAAGAAEAGGACASTRPAAPPTLPSELLERRPDIVQALRRLEAAQAGIASARAAWFPRITLGADARGEGDRLFDLLHLPAHLWSIGPEVAATLLDGGRRQARVDAATARRDEALALYRAAVLAAFQDVEDLLATRRELAARDRAAQAASAKAAALAQSSRRQRERGLASLVDELAARRAALEAELAWRDGVHESRSAELLLVKAIGGGWSAQAPR